MTLAELETTVKEVRPAEIHDAGSALYTSKSFGGRRCIEKLCTALHATHKYCGYIVFR